MKYSFPLSLLLLATITSCAKKETTPATNNQHSLLTYAVRVAPVSTEKLQDVVHVTALVHSDAEAKPSFKTGGVISRTLVKEGDLVQKGQLLATLNLTEIEAQAKQASLGVEKAQRDLQRVENLYKDSIATLEQLQNATTALELAKRTNQIAEFNIDYSQVRSPIRGKVISQLLHEGEIAAPGYPVFALLGVNPSDWKLVAGLTDKNWGRIREGNKATITFDAYPGWKIEGKVIRLSDVANPQSGTFDVEISIPGKDKRLAAGLLAHVEIYPSSEATFPTIPVEALVSSSGRTGIVFIPDGDKAVKKSVQIYDFKGEVIAIESGLEDVKNVITSGSNFLEDGDPIRIIE